MIIYIREIDKKDRISLLEKLKIKLNMILVKVIDEKRIVYIIPKIENERIYKKLNKKIKKYPNCKIVLSKKIKKYESQIECYQIIKGKFVQKSLLHKILQLVLGNLSLQDIYILSKKYESSTVNIIEYFLDKVRTVNIVTNEIQKYKKIEEQIYNEKGIIITVTNNRKKSLKKAKLIINLDLNNEEINKYNINRKSTIINIANEKINGIIGFEGIIINGVQIDLRQDIRDYFIEHKLYGFFENAELYESIREDNIKKEEIRLKELIGNNGIIDYKEIENIKK